MSRLPRWSQHCRAPLLILTLQAGPVEIRPTEDGTGYRLVFAAGAGQYESRVLGCDGSVESAEAVPAKAIGVSADIYPSPDVRVTGAIGAHDDGGAFTGAHGGFQVALERPKFGLGLGFTKFGGDSAGPHYYVRLGSREGAHFRAELASPNATGPLLGTARAGVGWNRTADGRAFGFAGFSKALYADSKHSAGFFTEFGIPVSDRVAIVAGAAYRPSEQHTDAAAQLGISLSSGRR